MHKKEDKYYLWEKEVKPEFESISNKLITIDNININGNTISSTAGTDLNITPLAGQQIVLDGTIVVDAGVVTGATSITSTALVGNLTGDVTGNADTATALETGRTIGMTGDVVWTSASFDGSGNVTGTATIQANSVTLGTDTIGNYVATITGGTGITSTGATSGESIGHTLSVDASQTQITSVGALDAGSITSNFGSIDNGSSTASFGSTTVSSLSVSDGNITNVGDISLDSISSDAGTSINVVLGSDAGDDFTVDTSKLVVEGDTGNVGIGTDNPSSALHIVSSTATDPDVIIENTNADTNSANLMLRKSSASPADGDVVGTIRFQGDDSGGTETEYGTIYVASQDVTNGTEDGRMYFRLMSNGSLDSRLVIDGSNVGIGTTDPAHKLDIQPSGSNEKPIRINRASTSAEASILLATNDSNKWVFGTDNNTSEDFQIYSYGTASAVFTIDYSTGNVGIGTSSPSQLLHIQNSSGFAGAIIEGGSTSDAELEFHQHNSGNATWALGVDHSNSKAFSIAYSAAVGASLTTNNVLTIDSSGNVGIGTTSPVDKLQIDAPHSQLRLRDTDDGTFTQFSSSGNKLAIRQNSTSANHIWLTSSGDVGIGETAPDALLTLDMGADDDNCLSLKSSDVAHTITDEQEADTYGILKKLHSTNGGLNVLGYGESKSGVRVRGVGTTEDSTRSTSSNAPVLLSARIKAPVTATSAALSADKNLVVIQNNSTTKFIFDSDGDAHADSSWTTFSDRRLKNNITSIPYGLNEVLQLSPKVYDKHSGYINNDSEHENYNDYDDGEVVLSQDSKRTIGFIAQDIKDVLPEIIKDVDESSSFYSMSNADIVPVLVKAIQELSARVAELESK